MRLEYSKDLALYGTKADIARAQEVLSKVANLPDGVMEDWARRQLQEIIDTFKLKAAILFRGNGVYSFDRTILAFKRVLKAGTTAKMSNDLYHFFSLCCGTIAHYSKYGWSDVYPDTAALRRLFERNEFGQSVVNHQPTWGTDRIKIAREMERLLQKGV